MTELISLIVTTISVSFGIITYYRESRRKVKKDTLDVYQILQSAVFDRINKWMPSEIKNATEDKSSDEYKTLSGYLAEIERFCIGLNEKIYDFGTFYELSHGYFDSEKGLLKQRLIPLLETKLKNAEEDYFANIHSVWKRMAEYQRD